MKYSSAATQRLLVSSILCICCCIYAVQTSVFIFIPLEINCILNFKAILDCLPCIELPVQSLVHSKPAIFPTCKFCVSANQDDCVYYLFSCMAQNDKITDILHVFCGTKQILSARIIHLENILLYKITEKHSNLLSLFFLFYFSGFDKIFKAHKMPST